MSVHPGPSSESSTNPIAPDRFTLPFLLVYRISRSALAARAPEGSSAVIELRMHISEDRVTLTLADPLGDERVLDLPMPDAAAADSEITIVRTQGGWLHLDAPSIVSVSIAGIDTKHPQLIYARTNILGSLGIAGGRFEPPILRSDG